MYQNNTEIFFFAKKLSKTSETYHAEPGLYPSSTDIVEALKSIFQKRHDASENCIAVELFRRFTLQMKDLAFHFSIPTSETISAVTLALNRVYFLEEKRPHEPEFTYGIGCNHSLMIDTDLKV